ncbi:MAG: hypothetical protein A2Z37_11820 [Chloroflexi bacterium RBG_19FT_COMBO_62_14]|nr:MAG: hypothetical protein A2Z37_11820 [Chloroflexi bacterium RBG_19FT_COMBO_62_14]
MESLTREQKVPGYQAERLFDGVERFRKAWARYHRPDDVNHLLRLFTKVALRRGYMLDYLPVGGLSSGWIWPYARRADPHPDSGPPLALTAMARDRLISMRGSGELRRVEIDTLYAFLGYETSPLGLFEYAVFISELWATKSASKASDWLDLVPVVTRRQFDGILRKAGDRVQRVIRPSIYDPLVRLDGQAGGEVRFMVFQGGAWKRITMLVMKVDENGSVRREFGDLVANLR